MTWQMCRFWENVCSLRVDRHSNVETLSIPIQWPVRLDEERVRLEVAVGLTGEEVHSWRFRALEGVITDCASGVHELRESLTACT